MIALAIGIVIALFLGVGLLCWATYELGYQRGWDDRGFRLSRRCVEHLKTFAVDGHHDTPTR